MNNNKLIAEFMGWDIKLPTTIPTNLHLSNLELDNKEIFDLKFHTSWDWLMPVVEKIYSIDADVDFFKNISLEDTYKAVVQFIKPNRKSNKL